MKKTTFNFVSSNQIDTIQAFIYADNLIKPKAIVQLSHGMCEYISRYDDFAFFLVSNGYIVCGNDHLGHGSTSGTTSIDGYFAPSNGSEYVLKDLYAMNRLVRDMHEDLPIVLLGHSMGSLFARKYASLYPDTIDALILSGTAGPNPFSNIGIALTAFIAKTRGSEYRSKLVDTLAMGNYCKKIKNSTSKHDWVTNDLDILEKYKKDEKCTFMFTVSAFHEVMRVLKDVNTQKWANTLDKDKPILMFSGDMDPVGGYFKGIEKVFRFLENANIKDLTLRKYPDGLHEMLNATNREEVYQDILCWLNTKF